MRRDDICLYLGPADRAELQALLTNRNTARKLAWRAEIVLATADGCGTFEIMRRAETSKPTVWRWQERYLDEGVAGLRRDKTRPSRVPPLPRETRLKVIAKTVREVPPKATHWSRSTMAEAVGISPSSVGRIWAEAGLKPHLTRRFKVSNDPMFEEKVTEIVGLYLDPPDRAVVLCVDEKSQIQALDRTQPGLPLKKGRAATSCWKHAFGMMTHDYKRHGTTTLFAALDVKSGLVIGDCMPRHRAKEFLTFLRRIDRAVRKPRDIHLVLDNYATHKTPEVMAWLEKHPRFKLHFTPTSASWMNLVERFFAEITTRRIRRGSYSSVDDLETAIYDYPRLRRQAFADAVPRQDHRRADLRGQIHARGIYSIGGVFDMPEFYADQSSFRAAMNTAWGATDQASFDANTVGYVPTDSGAAIEYTGKRARFAISTGDATVNNAKHSAVMAPLIAPHALESGTVSTAGGHLATAAFDPADVTSFFDRCF